MVTSETPPPFEPINVIELSSVESSKIVSVSLYSGRAEITRLYKLDVKTGQNQVTITHLPNVLDWASLWVEGRGAATIHDVTVSYSPTPPTVTTSPELSASLLKKERTQKALDRCKKSLASLESYLGTLNVERIEVAQIGNVVEKYETEAEKLDDRALELEKQLRDIDQEIISERTKLNAVGRGWNNKLSLQAAIGVFAEHEGEVEIALIYAVSSANWSAGYDIRVNMQTKEQQVTLIYKAAISQSTGEVRSQFLFVFHKYSLHPIIRLQAIPASHNSAGPPVLLRKTNVQAVEEMEESDDEMGFGIFDDEPSMAHREIGVSSTGNVSATFQVPGLITVPSDGQQHNVTIVQLKLDATLSWISVPKEDTKTHLKARIKNASDYTLFSGNASVYVDGSFISRSYVPPVSPEESFDCPLGIDPSIRIMYHPRSKKVTHSGFYQKTANHVFSQRITIFNSKSTAVDNVKIVDQIPVSENSQIIVKMSNPALTLPPSSGTTIANGKPPQPVDVSPGIKAQWDGTDEPGFDMTALGKDGKINWVSSMPAQGKMNLHLQWEVTAPACAIIVGW
ncbi:hypothetical protein BD410DRAFT_814727 [Rickenella mellea]|uniref:DUF4139 domain-containing protein n=1 Tax=Rickenella mellea TaxID=50990 RepID=A0A4Y7Q607_9AGAM|nr:hypothetical protein BD410DRAFT_814727 [Rickenella mellea]